jgi:hypothetical protein
MNTSGAAGTTLVPCCLVPWLVLRVVVGFLSLHESAATTEADAPTASGDAGPAWRSLDLVLHASAGGQEPLHIRQIAVQQPLLCSVLASIGLTAAEQSRALCGSEVSLESEPDSGGCTDPAPEPADTHIGPRRLQLGQSSTAAPTCSGNSNASLDVACTAPGIVLVENATSTPGSDESSCCTCSDGTTVAYDDEALAFRFRSEDITASADEDSLRWDAAVPSGLAFTMTRPPDPIATQSYYAGLNFSEPSRVVPPGVPAGLHFESGPEATYDQAMYSNRKLAVGAENTFFAAVTPAAKLAMHGMVAGFRAGDGLGCLSWHLANAGQCLEAGPGEVNENATGCVSSSEPIFGE